MRIKAVLRDKDILSMEPGTAMRIKAAAQKNKDRLVNLNSLLKIMGLGNDDRIKMLEALQTESIHIWLAVEANQHVVFLNDGDLPDDVTIPMYQWQ